MDLADYSLPIGDVAKWLVDYIKGFPKLLKGIRDAIMFFYDLFESFFLLFEPWILIILIALLAFWSGRKIGLALFSLIGLLLVWNLGYWDHMVYTLSLVLTSAIAAIIIGIPIGIWAAKSRIVFSIVSPVLDFMQTMPAFVYLIPVVTFFSIGEVPGIISAFIFSMPPVDRL